MEPSFVECIAEQLVDDYDVISDGLRISQRE